MQKIRIITFFFENRLNTGSLKWKKKLYERLFRLHIYLRTNNTLIRNSLYEFDSCGKNLSHKKMQYNYSTKMFTRKAKPIRITSVRIRGVLLYCVSLRAASCSQTDDISLSSSPSSSIHHYFTGSLWFIVRPTWQRLLSITVKVWGYSCPCARHDGTPPLILKLGTR
jgi:hypothetical protein